MATSVSGLSKFSDMAIISIPFALLLSSGQVSFQEIRCGPRVYTPGSCDSQLSRSHCASTTP